MWLFRRNLKDEIAELRGEIESLRMELNSQKFTLNDRTEIRIGQYPTWAVFLRDPRPIVSLKDVVLLLADFMKVDIKQNPEIPARTVIERKPKAPN